VRELRPELPPHTFERAPSRLLFLVAYAGIVATGMIAIASGWLPWFAWPLVSIAIGGSFAGMAFVAHEVLHGGIVRNKSLQYAIGWFAFLPFFLSPRLWMAWHNGVHHARTNQPGDPDSYPTLEEYRTRRTTRIAVDTFSPGARRWRGVLSLLFGFTGQSAHELLTGGHSRIAVLETLFGIAVWGTVALLVGVVPFVFVFAVPLMIGNTCVMAFILTNHALSPRVEINDPLISGLTVTVPPLVDWLTLGFGYHVEHHLFPAMSTRHAPAVRALVLARWPERYQSMSLGAALLLLHRSARVYQTPTTLYDPRTGHVHETLGARRASVDA